jgi:transposase-like protein
LIIDPKMHVRDGLSIHEIARRTGLARNTVRDWLRRPAVTEPKYPKRDSPTKLDAHTDPVSRWAIKLKERRGFGRAVVAIAAKKARSCWAAGRHGVAWRGRRSVLFVGLEGHVFKSPLC